MTTYICDGFRPIKRDGIEICNVQDAARTFATRKARKEYGKRGHCAAISLQSAAMDGSRVEFDAFIGAPSAEKHERFATVGRNVRLEITIQEAAR